MMQKEDGKRRIVTIDSPFGNYAIQEKVKGFLGLYSVWKNTHLFRTLEAAKATFEYLEDRPPRFGVVVHGEGYEE